GGMRPFAAGADGYDPFPALEFALHNAGRRVVKGTPTLGQQSLAIPPGDGLEVAGGFVVALPNDPGFLPLPPAAASACAVTFLTSALRLRAGRRADFLEERGAFAVRLG